MSTTILSSSIQCIMTSTKKPIIFYLHFNEAELNERIKPFIRAGYSVRNQWSTEVIAKWTDYIPDIVILSLDRLPSHSRHYAEWIWEAKERKHIPIILVDGKPDKVQETREKFPNAIYCSSDQLESTIKGIIKNEG